MKAKLIKTEADYQATLRRIEDIFDAKPDTPEGDELDLLSTLVELYEEKVYPVDMPSALDSIKFRMEQQGLKAKDMIPYIGSASKVSEVLSGKRTLSLTMIRNLVNGLGIPAEVLLQKEGAKLPLDTSIQQVNHFPIAEMLKRGWFSNFKGSLAEAKAQIEDLMNTFVGALGPNALIPTMNRQHVRLGSTPDDFALIAWRIRVANLALLESLSPYKTGTVTIDFLNELSCLSYFESGPLLAKEFLNKNGIHLIVERHLSKTHLDGAALKLPDGSPVVALTLRHDRLDNFWFTLLHELAHVALHLDAGEIEMFFDDLSEYGKMNKYEREANKMASDALIPESKWKASRLNVKSSPQSVVDFASNLRISPSIPAGRIRYESKNYTIFKPLIGMGKVRSLFDIAY